MDKTRIDYVWTFVALIHIVTGLPHGDWRKVHVRSVCGNIVYQDFYVPRGTKMISITCSNGPAVDIGYGWTSVAMYPPVLVCRTNTL